LSTRETVGTETPASWAMAAMVTRLLSVTTGGSWVS
jgi:hypothetical protein